MNNTQTHKILIADDNAEIREILHILLNGEGFEVVLACDGEKCIQLVDKTIDLIILDVNMSQKSGFIATSEIQKKTMAPILFLTARTGNSDKTMGFSTGGDDYITNPFSNSELLLKVKVLLRRYCIYEPQVKTVSPNHYRRFIYEHNSTNSHMQW
ncbi:response regulator [Cellulosilyticum ruminicola]|uniref:response regulator n=1 Tax=Cellulosilyticum ruminicola TaxID=425254 RepID=UPI00278C0CDC|nr:response regulator [Cellulosilyticum ruminicola]